MKFNLSEQTKDRLATLVRFIVIIPIISLGNQVVGWGHSVWAEHWLRKDSRPTAAIVTELHPKRVFEYRYTVDGKQYTGKSSRGWETDRDYPLCIGDATSALVSASHPSLSCLTLAGTPWIGLPSVVLMMIMEIFFLGVLADGILRLFFGIRFRNEQPEDSIAILILASLFVLFLAFAAFALRRGRSRQVKFFPRQIMKSMGGAAATGKYCPTTVGFARKLPGSVPGRVCGFCAPKRSFRLEPAVICGCDDPARKAMRRNQNLLLAVLTLSGSLAHSAERSTNDLIIRATTAVEAAAPRARQDPWHPIFHVASPAQWMNDPNGPIYYRGQYHLFYQLHPFSERSGPKYWGHVRSRDLAKWEPLPIALAPSTEAGESEVWSGCCTVNGEGKPMIFYTSIATGESPQTHAEQWTAIGDWDLLSWTKSPANPVLSESLHGGKKVYDWRDPFVFHEGKRSFMVLGGNLNQAKGGEAIVNIYEAENADLTRWKYRGVLFQIPGVQARTAECPNFFKLGNHWVLFVSPYGKVQYFVGDFDSASCRFHARTSGLLDLGPNFYAPNTMQVPDGRRIVWGWVNGFPDGHGWNGCLSVPRVLSLSDDGRLQQSPAPQLTKLRGKPIQWRNLNLAPYARSLRLPQTNTLEIRAEIDLDSAKGILLTFKNGTEPARRVRIEVAQGERNKSEADIVLALDAAERHLDLDLFMDRSVIEVFGNGSLCATKVISPLETEITLEFQAVGGGALAKSIRCWPMRTIW